MIFNEFEGKRVLITGGSSGIGEALALKLNQCGAKVGVISNNESEFSNMQSRIGCYLADVRVSDQVYDAVDRYAADAGTMDMLVNSAGVSLWKDFLDMDSEFWDLIYDVNVKGTFLATQAVTRYMIRQKSGIILNIASMSGLKSGMPGASAYMSSKWAIVGLSRNLHLELKKFGIKVSCFCPGSTRTALHEKANTPNREEMLDPADVANTIMFMLAAPEKGHIQLLAQPAFFEEWK